MGLIARTLPIALMFQVASQEMNYQYNSEPDIQGISKVFIELTIIQVCKVELG